ncbi:autotransporter assembly complex protein TamA [Brevundimonas sp.]
MKSRHALFLISTAGFMALATATQADPRAEIRGELDRDLRAQLVRAIGDVDDPPSNRFEARRRARAAMESAEALLRSEGYYQPTLVDQVEGEETPVAIVEVTPGPRFLLADYGLNWTLPPPDQTTDFAVRDEVDLTTGEPGRAADVLAAEGRIVAGLTRRGYADAAALQRRVVVNHRDYSVTPNFNINSGPLVRLDGILLETRGPTNPDWVAGLAPWTQGDVYDPEQVAELEQRLTETGVYDGVGVALSPADQTLPDGTRPIVVTLRDRPARILEAGITLSTARATVTAGTTTSNTGGSAIEGLWTWYNRFGRADTLIWQARLADIDSRIGATLSLPHWRRPSQTLRLETAVVHEDTEAYRRTALVLAADIRQRVGKTSFYSYGVGLDAGQYDENRFDPITQAPIRLTRDLVILTGRGNVYWDKSNNALDPTSGWRLTASVQPTAVAGEDTIVFLRTEAQVTGYLPLQEAKTVLAGRIKLGSIVGGEELTVPADRLFYSGGGGSVRGYEYQGVGPRLPDNTPRGGLSLFETSLEVRRDVFGGFQGVAFVDAGAVGFDETPDFSNMRYAAGVGVRYKLPFGPIRADIAIPLDKREGDAAFQVYISLGQAF